MKGAEKVSMGLVPILPTDFREEPGLWSEKAVL